jgi:hypothetical protein
MTAELGGPGSHTVRQPNSAVLVVILYDRRTRRSLCSYCMTAKLYGPRDITVWPPNSAVLVIMLYDRRTRRSV